MSSGVDRLALILYAFFSLLCFGSITYYDDDDDEDDTYYYGLAST